MDEPKDNKAEVRFFCFEDSIKRDCVYYKSKSDSVCDYLADDYICSSAEAQVNRMTLELKRLGLNNE